MKKTLFILFLINCVQLCHSQSQLFGTWTASCPMERKNISSMSFCDLCPTLIKDNVMKMDNFEMQIDKDEIKVTMGSKITSLKYKWDGDTDSIYFEYSKNPYQFKVLTTSLNDQRILKDKDGFLLLLSKK